MVPVLRMTTEMKHTGRGKRDPWFQTCLSGIRIRIFNIKKEKNDFIVMDRERECFSTAQIFIFSSKAPTAKEETPPLHLSPTRKHRLKIYNTPGMCEERSAFIRTIFPTVAH